MSRRLWRVRHPDLAGGPGRVIELSGDESHHVRRVLRLAAGATLGVFDGCGAEWESTLLAESGGTVRLRLERPIDAPVEAPLALTLFQGRCRPDRFDWVVQKSTELGLVAVHALDAQRAAGAPPVGRRLDRWRRLAVEACKQSGRRIVPCIEFFPELPASEVGTLALLLDTSASAPPLGARLEGERPARVWLAVGPEGGFSAEEAAAAATSGWLSAGLGPRVLRTETAGIVAAAVILHRWADLGPAGPGNPG